MKNAILLSTVSKLFGQKRAVNQFDLEVPEGSIYGFIGPNGSGKTTTLRMILRIFFPDEGTINLFDQPLTQKLATQIGYLPEERGLYKKMRVIDALRFFAQLKDVKNPNKTIYQWLDKFSLSQNAQQKIEELSKGMSQKVQFISSVIHKPQLLILDEPFSGLDPVSTEVLKEAILALNKEGTTVIFSTHDMNMAEQMCEKICMIYQGNKVLDGSLSSIQKKYPADTIKLKLKNPHQQIKPIDGVNEVTQQKDYLLLKIGDCESDQNILSNLIDQYEIELFEITKPSLYNIFLKVAQPAEEIEQSHA